MGNLESVKKLVRLAPQLLTAQTGRIYGESDATPAGLAEELKHVEVARYRRRMMSDPTAADPAPGSVLTPSESAVYQNWCRPSVTKTLIVSKHS